MTKNRLVTDLLKSIRCMDYDLCVCWIINCDIYFNVVLLESPGLELITNDRNKIT